MRKTLLAALLSACAATYLPRANSHDEVRAYVERAARVVEKHGAAACQTLKQPQWYSGDWYVFVSELGGATICHPARPDLIGRIERELKDPNGKAIGEEILRAASGPERSGWIEYVWARPGRTQPVPKSTYVRAVTGPDGKTYVVGSGGYELR
jgi:methyl-accepting chemotaxis protein